MNREAEAHINAAAADTQAAVDAGNWDEATNLWGTTESQVLVWTNGVNFYNVLAKEDIYKTSLSKHHDIDLTYMKPEIRKYKFLNMIK